ncbi:MAG TPA: putative baseplate assembly protein, partial [Thermoanaerobaculia bacterium]|nr:putative baseplate assembly protein [Thermoanaerobaculia bacterium]
YDLLDSGPDDAEFVAEIDDDGRAHLRFGDGWNGRAVEVGMTFRARYRTGNGRAGLVGPEGIVHVVYRNGSSEVIARVRNPLPSTGASAPEPVAEVKMLAPMAFRKDLQRAITGEDYATLAQYLRYPVRNPAVQGAAGSLVWTGSWYEANVAVDPFGSSTLGDPLRNAISGSLARYRRMGHDLRVDGARPVPLRLELDLCIKPDYLRAHVLAAAKDALRRFFHPDNLTFGEAVYISRIVAAVMAVDGVAEVQVKRLERIAQKTPGTPPENGILTLGRNEIARLDNDPAIPENGILSFVNVRGGR